MRETSSWGSQLEWPQEVVGLLEVWTNSPDLVDQVLNANNSVLAQHLLDGCVTGQRNSLFVNLAVASLEDQLSDCLSGWVTEGNVWLNSSQKVDCRLVDSDESAVVQLSESQESEDSDRSGVEFINTSNSDDESQSGFSGYEDLSSQFSLS